MPSKTIENIIALFEAIDQQDWNKVHSLMSNQVLLDFTSFSGGEPSTLSPIQITASWANLLPGFDSTHHQLSDFRYDSKMDKQHITFAGKTDHFIDDVVYTVFGIYYVETEKNGLINLIKFNFKNAEGDHSLPQKAMNKVSLKAD